MKKLFTFIAVAITAISTFASSTDAINLRDEMIIMAQRLNFANRADSVEEFQNSMTKFIDAAEKSKATLPPKWNGDTSQFSGYQQGLQKVIDIATQASELAKQNKLNEAKEKLYELPELRKMYHKLYK
ncbi:cytochrome b562 [Rodentibacter caecimuris]|uniref:cytochrome b562 n=1 Tax=Rodentibacter caecimuris TaxID=1796644 RepID=UPI0013A07FB6|nr:cytochrome b562 [Rodentibacter heylii]MCX2961631.1 cytochrome b562 [Rodentibacter heylii]QIA77519.1 cytochrome B562 [Rodentibacter heylii]